MYRTDRHKHYPVDRLMRESMAELLADCEALAGQPGAYVSMGDVAKMLRCLLDGEDFVFMTTSKIGGQR